jgi:hypothetical protein
MEKSAVLAPVPKQKVSIVEREGPGRTVWLDSQGDGDCPICGTGPDPRHGSYVRPLRDLPAQGTSVLIQATRRVAGSPRAPRFTYHKMGCGVIGMPRRASARVPHRVKQSRFRCRATVPSPVRAHTPNPRSAARRAARHPAAGGPGRRRPGRRPGPNPGRPGRARSRPGIGEKRPPPPPRCAPTKPTGRIFRTGAAPTALRRSRRRRRPSAPTSPAWPQPTRRPPSAAGSPRSAKCAGWCQDASRPPASTPSKPISSIRPITKSLARWSSPATGRAKRPSEHLGCL